MAPTSQQMVDRNRWLGLQETLAAVYEQASIHHPEVRAARRATVAVYGRSALQSELRCDGGRL